MAVWSDPTPAIWVSASPPASPWLHDAVWWDTALRPPWHQGGQRPACSLGSQTGQFVSSESSTQNSREKPKTMYIPGYNGICPPKKILNRALHTGLLAGIQLLDGELFWTSCCSWIFGNIGKKQFILPSWFIKTAPLETNSSHLNKKMPVFLTGKLSASVLVFQFSGVFLC